MDVRTDEAIIRIVSWLANFAIEGAGGVGVVKK